MTVVSAIPMLCKHSPYIQRLRADLEDREAQLRAQEEEMKERDAETNRLLGELRKCQAQLQEQQVANQTTMHVSIVSLG